MFQCYCNENCTDAAPNTTGFKQVCVGKNQVWAVTNGGAIMRREGISPKNPGGTGWDIGIPVSHFALYYNMSFFYKKKRYKIMGFALLHLTDNKWRKVCRCYFHISFWVNQLIVELTH